MIVTFSPARYSLRSVATRKRLDVPMNFPWLRSRMTCPQNRMNHRSPTRPRHSHVLSTDRNAVFPLP